MEPLPVRLARCYEQFRALPQDPLGGVRVPGQLRQDWIDCALEVLLAYPALAPKTRAVLRLLTRRSA
jgi:hypothetical protein